MWDKTKLKNVKRLYEENISNIPIVFKTKEDYVSFLMAQTYQESGWDESAISKTGCKGLAQFENTTWKFVWTKLLKTKDLPDIWDLSSQIKAQDTYMKFLIKSLKNKEPMLPRKELIAYSLMAYNGGLSLVEWCIEYHGIVSVIALRDYRYSKKCSYPSENKIMEILNYPISIFHIWKSIKEYEDKLLYNKDK